VRVRAGWLIAIWIAFVVLLMISSCSSGELPYLLNTPAPTLTATPVVFAEVQLLLEQTCTVARCHSRESLAGHLDLSAQRSYGNLVGKPSAQKPGAQLVLPFHPLRSYLLDKLRGAEGILGARMPIGREPLADEQELLVEQWVSSGARP
jgi:hypothetical protein